MRFIVAVVFWAFSIAAAQCGPAAVQTILDSWTDASRDRIIPYKVYFSASTGQQPVILFSHGLGGNREGSAYLMEHWAANGFVVIALQHPGSDTDALRSGAGATTDPQAMRAALARAMTGAVAVERFRDVPFAIDQLSALNTGSSPLKNRLNLNRIGMSGHSFGALTTLALAGETLGQGESFADQRIKAAIAMSPNAPRGVDPVVAFAGIHIPTLHMTGTDDGNPLGNSSPLSSMGQFQTKPSDRIVPYASIKGTDKFLLVLAGGDHMVFSGRRLTGQAKPTDDVHHDLIKAASLAFWNAYLLEKSNSRAFLTDGSFQKMAGANGRFEYEMNSLGLK